MNSLTITMDLLELEARVRSTLDTLSPTVRAQQSFYATAPNRSEEILQFERFIATAIKNELGKISSYPVIAEDLTFPALNASTSTFWIVDPLDGTGEYLKGTKEYSINVALIHNGHPILGICAMPSYDVIYTGIGRTEAFKEDRSGCTRLLCQGSSQETLLKVGVSCNGATKWERELCHKIEGFPVSSKGLAQKHIAIAENGLSISVSLNRLNSWDIAALIPIVTGAGGTVRDLRTGNEPLFASTDSTAKFSLATFNSSIPIHVMETCESYVEP